MVLSSRTRLMSPPSNTSRPYPNERIALLPGEAKHAKVRPHASPVDVQGLIVDAGRRRARRARAVFVTPSHQFPTGVAMSMVRRLELLAWARQSGASRSDHRRARAPWLARTADRTRLLPGLSIRARHANVHSMLTPSQLYSAGKTPRSPSNPSPARRVRVQVRNDSPLEGAVHCELVSETRTQIRC